MQFNLDFKFQACFGAQLLIFGGFERGFCGGLENGFFRA
jgi:hypothetical protein